MNEYAVIVDPGKKRDPAVFFVMKDSARIIDGVRTLGAPDRLQHFYDIKLISQMQGRSYPEMVDSLCTLVGMRDLANNHDLLVDGTGVGEAVVDIMRAKGLTPIPIVATVGGQVREVYAEMGEIFGQTSGKLRGIRAIKEIHVPKEDLVAAGLLLVQQGRVRYAKGLRWAEEFDKQLKHFKGTENERTRRKSYEADALVVHDDMVSCFLMGAWWFTRHRQDDNILPSRPESGKQTGDGGWDPGEFME